MTPYVDPPPGGYCTQMGEPTGSAFDELPWVLNEGDFGPKGRMHVAQATNGPSLTFRDIPRAPPGTTIKYKSWLVVLDDKGNLVAWTGVGLEWTWSNTCQVLKVSEVKPIQGEPDKEMQPAKIFPPSAE